MGIIMYDSIFRQKYGFWELIQSGFNIVLLKKIDFLKIALIFNLPMLIAVGLFTYGLEKYFNAKDIEQLTAYVQEPTTIMLFLLSFIFMIWSVLGEGASMIFCENSIKENGKDLKDSFKASLNIFPAFILTAIVSGVLIFASAILFIIPSLIVIIYLAFTYQLVFLRKITYIDAIKYSFKLVKNNWWFTFGISIVLYLLFRSIPSLFSEIFGLVNIHYFAIIIVKSVFMSIAGMFMTPIMTLYFLNIEAQKNYESYMQEAIIDKNAN
jgi:hypothetical protein